MSGKPEIYKFKPKINNRSKKIAVNFRKKMLDKQENLGPDKSKKHKFIKSNRVIKSSRRATKAVKGE
jgi:hypothetical protein